MLPIVSIEELYFNVIVIERIAFMEDLTSNKSG